MKQLSGVISIISTPFAEDGEIDEKMLRTGIAWLFSHGVSGVATGMVSEVFRLAEEERTLLVRCMVEEAKGRGTVVASVGAESTFMAIRLARVAEQAGADGLMAIPPAMTRCGKQELMDYYRALVEAVGIPVIVQDASGYVGNSIPLEVQAKLLELFPDRILFKPEAQPIGQNVTALLEATGGKARIFEGLGGLALIDTFPRGIAGTMPGPEMPWVLVALWEALNAGDKARVSSIHGPLAAMISMMNNLDAFVATEKMLLVEQGVFNNTRTRSPVGYHLDSKTRETVLQLFDQLKKVCGTARK